ncbi:hypothetical protein [Sphingomonas sp. GC_Shp_3]|uniref:hypothetical protein n=1 Tax=Sphingomonas sp. GC_Shp_3 TaxID=2937383 RepID=UPI00226A0A36|nr:hypothetical protein [Sphingomonas sp. GC_Shp_3]
MHNTSQTHTIDSEFQLFTEAASGSPEAYVALAEWAAGAGDAGNIRAVVADEAAASLRAFAACLKDEHAAFPLGRMFDGATDDELVDIRLLYRSAAKGNVSALISLVNMSLDLTTVGVVDTLIGLSNAEVFGRLGASTGDPEATRLLIATLAHRSDYEEQAGQFPAAQYLRMQAVDFAAVLHDSNDAGMQLWAEHALRILIPTIGDDGLVQLATEHPLLISFMLPRGNA